jgi:carbonic anhydrase
MEKILKGYRTFCSSVFPAQRELFEQLAREQRPHALFVTCSDSRIHPNLITQTEPGELFILRNPGNLIPPYSYSSAGTSEAATIEYAVSVLNVQDIIICGHSNCGAMTALLRKEQLPNLPAVDAWLHNAESTRRVLLDQGLQGADERNVDRAVQLNVLAQLDNLRTHPSVAAGLSLGRIRAHGWVYDIGSGQIVRYDAQRGAFRSLIDPVSGPSA